MARPIPEVDTLAALKEYAWRGEMKDDLGEKWSERYATSDSYHKDNSWDWEENRKLLVDFRQATTRYGTYVAMGIAVLINFITDIYFRNPDVWIEDKNGDKDLGKQLSALFDGIHRDCKTERKMKEALFDAGWSLGAVMIDFEQEDHEEHVPITHPVTGQPIVDDEGNVPQMQDDETGKQFPFAQVGEDGQFLQQTIVDKQRIIERRIEPWRLRFDPDGIDPEFEDHKYLFVRFRRSLGQCMEDSRFTDEGKRKLIAWFAKTNADNFQNLNRLSYAIMGSGKGEEDPDFLMADLIEVWDRVNHQIVYLPEGANFSIGDHAWPKWLAEKDLFPVRVIGFVRAPGDESGLQGGFYPVPLMRLIKPQLYNINRLEALGIEGNTHVVNKYIAPAGLFSETEIAKLQTDKNRELITYDPKSLGPLFGSMGAGMTIGPNDIKSIFVPIDQGVQPKENKHIEMIEHELNVIAQILGQSSGDRGGLAESGSATEALGLQQRLQQRLSEQREEAAKHYNALTQLMYCALKSMQVLPMRYQMKGKYNQSEWSTFSADQWEDLDLNFDYSTAPQEARTREQEQSLRQQAAQVVMPILQETGDIRTIKALVLWMLEPMQLDDEIAMMLGDNASGIAAQLLQINMAIQNGQMAASDMRVAALKQELESSLIQATISTSDINKVAQQGAGGGQPGQQAPAPPGHGTPASPARSSGQKAAAMAAAGTVGGMSKGMVN